MTKNTCYFILHRVSNIDLRNAENSISGPLDFKIFWGDMPPDPPRGSRLWRSYLITPLNKYSCQYEHPSKNLSYAPEYCGACSLTIQRHSLQKLKCSLQKQFLDYRPRKYSRHNLGFVKAYKIKISTRHVAMKHGVWIMKVFNFSDDKRTNHVILCCDCQLCYDCQ